MNNNPTQATTLLKSEDGLVQLLRYEDRLFIDVRPAPHTRCRILSDGTLEIAPLVSEFKVMAAELARQMPALGLTLHCTAKDKTAAHRKRWAEEQMRRLARKRSDRSFDR